MLPELTSTPVGDGQPQLCSYCSVAPAVEGDHIINNALRRQPDLHLEEWDEITVPSCRLCNGRKYTLHRVPDNDEWRGRLDELYELTGHRFYTWNGDPKMLHPKVSA